MKKYFEFKNDNSAKFWEITSNKDFSIETRFGKIGSDGRISKFENDTLLEQKKMFQKKIDEKTKKGYVEIKNKVLLKVKKPVKSVKSNKTIKPKANPKAKKSVKLKANPKKTVKKQNNNLIKQKIEFVPQMFDNNKVLPLTPQALELASKHKKQLLAWYKKFTDMNMYLKSSNVTMNDHGVIIVNYTFDKDLLDDFYPESILDPDSDGNHPIKKYLVSHFKFSLKKLLITKVIKDHYVKSSKLTAKVVVPKKKVVASPTKKKIVIKKKHTYDNEWATTPDKYVSGVPSKAKLVKRVQMIDEIYKMHKEIKKLDKDSLGAIDPQEYRTPPEYCDEYELKSMVGLLRDELKELTKPKKAIVKKPTAKAAAKPKAKVAAPKKVENTSKLGNNYKANWDVKKQGVMLAHTFKDPKTGKIKSAPKGFTQAPNGWYASEKFDGYRAIWDGKDFRSRAGNIFEAPSWFKLWMPPGEVLDGELFMGRENFEECGIFRKKHPDSEEWKKAGVKYQIFDAPNHKGMFEDRQKHIKKVIKMRCDLKSNVGKCPLILTTQKKVKNEEEVKMMFQKLVSKGAEGIMLRAPQSPYEAKRSSFLLKVKQSFDDECKIIGYKEGSGKYKGMLGAFHCQLLKNPKIEFDISGMNDQIRANYKKTHKIGTIVTFSYMGLSTKGVPRHPVYQRIRKGKL